MRWRRSRYDLDSWRDTDAYRALMRATVCKFRDHKWRTKMYAKFCDRCGTAAPGWHH